jgi:glutamate-5-semialdehyde dehydrogenase
MTIATTMQQIGSAAVAAQGVLAAAPGEQRDRALHAIAAALRGQQAVILAANALDMAAASTHCAATAALPICCIVVAMVIVTSAPGRHGG